HEDAVFVLKRRVLRLIRRPVRVHTDIFVELDDDGLRLALAVGALVAAGDAHLAQVGVLRPDRAGEDIHQRDVAIDDDRAGVLDRAADEDGRAGNLNDRDRDLWVFDVGLQELGDDIRRLGRREAPDRNGRLYALIADSDVARRVYGIVAARIGFADNADIDDEVGLDR